MQLQDVAVLITGGGSGLGAATARAMAAKGAKIGVIDQNKENAEKVAAEVKGVALHADVTDEEAIKAAIAKAEAAHGIARQQRQQQAVLVAEMIFHQRCVDAGLLRDVGQRHLDRGALDHQFAGRDKQLLGGGISAGRKPGRYAGIQL